METSGNISIRDVGSKEEEVDLTYKIKDVGTEEEAKKIKQELDHIFQKKGAVTTLNDFMPEK
jgi:hypothetical protein